MGIPPGQKRPSQYTHGYTAPDCSDPHVPEQQHRLVRAAGSWGGPAGVRAGVLTPKTHQHTMVSARAPSLAACAALALAHVPRVAAHGAENHGGDGGGADTVVVAKAVAAVLYFVLTFAAGWLVRPGASPVLLSFANVFSAGVFFATGLLHMLYAGVIEFDALEWTDEYPVAFAVALGAFVATQGVDLWAQQRAHEGRDGDAAVAGPVAVPSKDVDPEDSMVPYEAADALTAHEDGHHAHTHAHAHAHAQMQQSVLGVLLVSFFSHSIVEGLAIGIQSELSSVVQLGVSLFLHKAFAAVALGIALVRNVESRAGRAARLAAFAIATPVGIVVALLLHENTTGSTQLALAAFLDSASAGAFVYIALFGVLLPEIADKEALRATYWAFAGGCGCIAAFMLWH